MYKYLPCHPEVCGEQGKLEQVKLQRMAKSLIADKTKMFDLFTRILDRSQKGKDSELIKYVQEATDFWTLMMLEEHRYDQISMHNMNCMQDACQNWLDELLLILNSLHGIAHAGAKEGIEAQKAQVLALKNTWKASLVRDWLLTGTKLMNIQNIFMT
jgi:hypothetical protein